MKKLTIGSAVYDDFEGVYFTYQSLRLNNQKILDDLDFIIIDNNPDSAEGKATKAFCRGVSIRYIPYTERQSTSVRNEIFNNSEAEYCMSIDSHVLFEPTTISKLIKFLEKSEGAQDLYHGPMLYDDIVSSDPVVQMDREWRDHMLGTWKSAKIKGAKPFEIPMHGMGIFVCKTDAWLGFNDNFSGFGGEEGYIHEKFRQAGRKVWCLPFLKWVHRFQRPRGVQYPLDISDRIRNYFIGFLELGLDTQEITDHFAKTAPDVDCASLLSEAESGEVPPQEARALVSVGKSNVPQVIRWDVSSIKFNEALPFKYLKLEFFSDCFLREVKLLPASKPPSIFSYSTEGVETPEALLSGKTDKFSTISAGTDSQELTLEYPTVLTTQAINIYHNANCHIMVFASEDNQSWTLISEITS